MKAESDKEQSTKSWNLDTSSAAAQRRSATSLSKDLIYTFKLFKLAQDGENQSEGEELKNYRRQRETRHT